MHRLFSWTADAVGCWARLVVGVCSPFQKIDHDKSMVDYSAKCAPAFAPAHTIPIDIHHRHALTCDLRIPNPAWFRDSTDLFFHLFLSQPGRKACFYPPPPGLFFYGAPRIMACGLHCCSLSGVLRCGVAAPWSVWVLRVWVVSGVSVRQVQSTTLSVCLLSLSRGDLI